MSGHVAADRAAHNGAWHHGMLEPFRNLSIRSKVLASALSPLFIGTLFTIVYFPAREKRTTIAAITTRTSSTAEVVALGVGLGLSLNQYAAVSATFVWAKRDPDLAYIVVVDSQRNVFASYNPDSVPVPALGAGSPLRTVREANGLLNTAVPIRYEGNNYGVLLLGMSLKWTNEQLVRDHSAIVLATAVILGIGVFISAFFAYLISAPITALRQITDKVADGNYDLEIPAGGTDEIGALSRAFAAMVTRVRQSVALLNDQAVELRAARDEALSATQTKSAFLAMMSHEIRTPMNGVLGMLELLMDEELSPKQRQYAETSHSSGEALLAIIDDVLDVSKIEAGKLTINSADFDLRRMVEEAAEIIAPPAHAKGLELIATVDPKVPEMLSGDAGRLRQILVNLGGNAVKFTERGEVVVEITLAEEVERGVTLRVTIRDTGIGVPAEAQAKLFQPFVQAEASTTRRFGGTGLGLAICKQLVEMMGGEIGMESRAGKGSTFWFTVRLRIAQAPTHKLPFRHLGRLRILVVDDNTSSRQLLERQVSAWGLAGVVAGNAAEAVEILRRASRDGEPYDVAIIDHHMPRVSGVALIRRLRKDPLLASVRTLLLTSLDVQDMREAKACLPSAFLPKPLRQSRLFDCLAGIMALPEPGRVAEPSAAPDTAGKVATVETSAIAPSGLRILLAEDHEVNQAVAKDLLGRLGHSVDIAPNGRAAVGAVERNTYDLVFMDCQMPEMDGFEATGEIRKLEAQWMKRTPIIAMTANAMEGDRERCIAAGMDDYLSKPIRRDRLAAVLAQWLPRSPEPGPAEVATAEAAPAVAPASPSPVDLSQLESLVGEGTETRDRYLRLFLTTTEPILHELEAAIAKADANEIRMLAHKAKGSAATIGAEELATLLGQMEKTAGAGNLDGMPGRQADVLRSFGEVQSFVESLVAGDPSMTSGSV